MLYYDGNCFVFLYYKIYDVASARHAIEHFLGFCNY